MQTSYEKAGQIACPEECVTKETVMRQARKMDIPEKSQESPVEKKKVKYLYVEADEDRIALQFHEKKGDIIGSSTESHISHVLSSRLSSRPKGWCKEGADKITQLRIYWKNGGDMLEIVRWQKEEKITKKIEEEKYFSSSEIFAWEKKHNQVDGKYIEALQASINSQISAKIFFNAAIAGLC